MIESLASVESVAEAEPGGLALVPVLETAAVEACGPAEPCGPAELAMLLRCAGHGDQDAFAALYDATSARAYGLALRVVGDRALAEEVLLEAYLEIWRSSARLDATGGGPMAWILMVVHRAAVNLVRTRPAKTRRSQETRESRLTHRDGRGVGMPDSFAVRRLRKALADLPPRQRAAQNLAYFGGHTHTEVDNILGFRPGIAEDRIRAGLARLAGSSGQE